MNNMSAPTDQHYALELLRRAQSNPNAEFRDGQWEAIDTIVNQRRKMLVVQRTGWGKSNWEVFSWQWEVIRRHIMSMYS